MFFCLADVWILCVVLYDISLFKVISKAIIDDDDDDEQTVIHDGNPLSLTSTKRKESLSA